MSGALDDIRVIDFTHALNGPFCTMLLGHMGAEIVKVEPPEGDSFRRSWMPPNSKVDGYEFLWINANKKSVVINLKIARGAELARQLIARADIVVENYHTGTMEKFGLGYDELKKINPRLIYACSRGFGESGPYKDYGSTAHTNNSMTGWTHTGWTYSGAPGTKAIGIGDEAAGVSMVCGILAALHARERSGEGQRIVVSMQEALLGFMISEFHEHFIGIEIGNKPVPVADGYFTLRIPDLRDSGWAKLIKFMERDDLLEVPANPHNSRIHPFGQDLREWHHHFARVRKLEGSLKGVKGRSVHTHGLARGATSSCPKNPARLKRVIANE